MSETETIIYKQKYDEKMPNGRNIEKKRLKIIMEFVLLWSFTIDHEPTLKCY